MLTIGLTNLYTDIMEAESDHVAAVDDPIAVLSADIRRGHPFDQRRRFGLAAVGWLADHWKIP